MKLTELLPKAPVIWLLTEALVIVELNIHLHAWHSRLLAEPSLVVRRLSKALVDIHVDIH